DPCWRQVIELEIVGYREATRDFVLLPGTVVVVRISARPGRFRRVARHDERLTEIFKTGTGSPSSVCS
ncbi:hypothetical protein D6833_03815, partial [Candidatus Parcubacteria bacterium]